ncbi:MAG: hypothetical protein OEW80_05395, partial [Gemmatimonadota bacterium]|nr:hypothetical protein [Gemmatimonadota bacterium]
MFRAAALAVILTLAAPALLAAQYFGQNRVQYRSFDFLVLRTEHFDVHYYAEARQAALDAARMAERSYARLSRILRHEYRERKPIILYASHSDFQQTNALGGSQPGEGTGGVTDFFRQRILLPFTGSYEELDHVLQHEMVHQFQYDIWSRGKAGAGLQTLINVNPPLWFVEGMAEYLSIGRVDPNTAMWLRDAAREGKIPTIEQLETDPYIFPYRFGQGLLAFIGERWGDESIGAIMQGTLAGGGGLQGSVRRVLGLDYPALSKLWRQHLERSYLTEIVSRESAGDIARPVLTNSRSDGTLHLSPALSPDGKQVAFFGEGKSWFVDLYLADATTGHVSRRLAKSSYSTNYETFRFITSAVSWSPDGKRLALVTKRGPKDDLVILDVKKNWEIRRIELPLNGATTPDWSPDGRRLVFSGYDGGLSDLFLVDANGENLRRLTNDRYADLHPVWSPDGATIAFTTDRGPVTDFDRLIIGNMRIATYDLGSGEISVLPGMEGGKNSSPQWSPDGTRIAFVSDRSGVSNIYLYDRRDAQVYQISDFYTGAQGITPLSPTLSWARGADRLAFVHYARDNYDVYVLENPVARQREPWGAPALAGRDSAGRPVGVLPPVDTTVIGRDSAGRPVGVLPPVDTTVIGRDSAGRPVGVLPSVDTTVIGRDSAGRPVGVVPGRPVESVGSIYVSKEGLRQAEAPRAGQDSVIRPPTISSLMDSLDFQLPDTAEFSEKKYKVSFRPDYVAQPTIGYTRDNFGNGVYGGSAIALSDMLGDHTLYFSLYLNGRITEAQLAAYYINRAKRLNWAVGLSQQPYYYLEPTIYLRDTAQVTEIANLRRSVERGVSGLGSYPVSRFQRVELGLTAAIVDDQLQQVVQRYTLGGLPIGEARVREVDLGSRGYTTPSVALVFDNSLFGWVAPFQGRRWRVQLSRALGGFNFFQSLADFRRYDRLVGPVSLATRILYYGRSGPDAERAEIFLGNTELVRGHTSGSYYGNECLSRANLVCYDLERLIGTRVAVFNAELRFPILTPNMSIAPRGFPPIEGALFF